jgi:hypothetical protein
MRRGLRAFIFYSSTPAHVLDIRSLNKSRFVPPVKAFFIFKFHNLRGFQKSKRKGLSRAFLSDRVLPADLSFVYLFKKVAVIVIIISSAALLYVGGRPVYHTFISCFNIQPLCSVRAHDDGASRNGPLCPPSREGYRLTNPPAPSKFSQFINP